MKTNTRKSPVFWMMLPIGILALIMLIAYLIFGTGQLPNLKRPIAKKPTPNAFDYYNEAGYLLVGKDIFEWAKSDTPIGYINSHNPRERYYTLSERKAVIKDNAGALKKLREGFKYDCCVPTVIDYTTLLPYLAKFRDMERFLKFSSWNHENSGNYDEAMRLRLDGLELSNDSTKNGVLIHALVNAGSNSIITTDIYTLIDKLNLQTTKKSVKRLEIICNDITPLSDIYEQEKWSTYGSLKMLFSQPNWRFKNDFTISMGGNTPDKAIFKAKWATIRPRNVCNNMFDYYDKIIIELKKPFPLIKEVKKPNDLINDLMIIETRKMAQRYTEGTRMQTMLLTALALKAFSLENNKYPNTLQELVPKYLKELPSDPYSVKGIYKYKNKGNKFLLYSIGPDGKDNGGVSIPRLKGKTKTIIQIDSIGDIVWGVK